MPPASPCGCCHRAAAMAFASSVTSTPRSPPAPPMRRSPSPASPARRAGGAGGRGARAFQHDRPPASDRPRGGAAVACSSAMPSGTWSTTTRSTPGPAAYRSGSRSTGRSAVTCGGVSGNCISVANGPVDTGVEFVPAEFNLALWEVVDNFAHGARGTVADAPSTCAREATSDPSECWVTARRCAEHSDALRTLGRGMASAMTGVRNGRGGTADAHANTGDRWSHGLGDRSRVHGDVRVLRAGRRRRRVPHPRCRPGRRCLAVGLGRLLRVGPQTRC